MFILCYKKLKILKKPKGYTLKVRVGDFDHTFVQDDITKTGKDRTWTCTDHLDNNHKIFHNNAIWIVESTNSDPYSNNPDDPWEAEFVSVPVSFTYISNAEE